MRRLDLYDFLDSMSLEEKEILLEDLKAMISVEKTLHQNQILKSSGWK